MVRERRGAANRHGTGGEMCHPVGPIRGQWAKGERPPAFLLVLTQLLQKLAQRPEGRSPFALIKMRHTNDQNAAHVACSPRVTNPSVLAPRSC
jgi:hypothetical protein